MLREFKDFIMRGNVVDLAVGLVAGAAFGAVVTSLVTSLINPLIAFIVGAPDFSKALMVELPLLPWANEVKDPVSGGVQHPTLAFGAMITTIISFLGTMGGVFFLIVKPMNIVAARATARDADAAPTTKACPECCSEIPVAATRCAHCTSQLVA